MWQQSGFGAGSNESIAKGVLYYGDESAGGLRVQDFLTDISTEADLKDFLELCMPAQEVPGFIAPVEIECAKQLAIVDVSVENDPPSGCLKIFPAVVSLRPRRGFFNPDAPRRLSTPPLTPLNSTPTFARIGGLLDALPLRVLPRPARRAAGRSRVSG